MNWSEHDQMDVLVSLKERKKNAALREQLGLEPVSLVIKKGRLRGEEEEGEMPVLDSCGERWHQSWFRTSPFV